MASFFAGPTAQLLGAGLQAACGGIPMSNNCNKLLEGMRDVGLPVPPTNWFKSKGGGKCGSTWASSCQERSATKKTVFDTLESHIQGVMQVVKPVMELKSVINAGCKSADRGQRVGKSSPSDRMMGCPRPRSFSTDERCGPSGCRTNTPPQYRVPKKRQSVDRECRGGRGRCRTDSSDEEDEEACMYCSRSKCSMLKLPCGRAICAKCDKTEDHELQCKQCKKLSR